MCIINRLNQIDFATLGAVASERKAKQEEAAEQQLKVAAETSAVTQGAPQASNSEPARAATEPACVSAPAEEGSTAPGLLYTSAAANA